jgi:nucleoside 2-deoxyribosyltransferase
MPECPIWKSPAEIVESSGVWTVYDSPRAGGRYSIDALCLGRLTAFDDKSKRLLTTWICEQRRAGNPAPQMSDNVLEIATSRRPLPVTERLTRALILLAGEIEILGQYARFGGNDMSRLAERAAAETESQHLGDLSALYKLLEDVGLVAGNFYTDGSMIVRPSSAGWSEVDRLSKQLTLSTQGFVAMWFNPQTEKAYGEGIYPAIEKSGYQALRIDKKEHNNKIDDEIIAEIRRSRFVVADFTSEPEKPRGGVYYEAGFAAGLGIPVIWTCHASLEKQIHFDTRQYSHIFWQTPAELFERLKNRIGATIGDGPLKN